MDIDIVTTLIGTVGFPIVCVIFMALFIYRFSDTVIQYNKEREDKLYNLIAKSQEQLDRLEDSFEDYVVVLGKLRDDMNTIKEDLHDIEEKVK